MAKWKLKNKDARIRLTGSPDEWGEHNMTDAVAEMLIEKGFADQFERVEKEFKTSEGEKDKK